MERVDSPWEEDPQAECASEAHWSKISAEFTNSGYREGIIAGKEASLQDGFNAGFADVGVPLGRELGNLRGMVSALMSFLAARNPDPGSLELGNARDISSKLSHIRFSDIAPRDLEAERHAREHLDTDDPSLPESDELAEKRGMEGLEDMLSQLSAGTAGEIPQGRPTMADVTVLRQRLRALTGALGLNILE
ncbi:hypothetical protein F5I97DRAFT_1882473 [Phlebopus sp. FC_14]|nr:hypothetical protein F5I97DRAFT_1882473 [Phlebopus sp. FC_14]